MEYAGKIIFGLFGLFIALGAFFIVMDKPLNGQSADCYDRHNNKILGEQCIVEKSFDGKNQKIILGTMLAAAIWLTTFMLGYLYDAMGKFGSFGL
jgi:hypothetical protein